MGTDPLPAIGISSKKSCDEPIMIRLIRSLAHFFYSRALGIPSAYLGFSTRRTRVRSAQVAQGKWALGIGQ
ncbi:hypothetical protein LC613_21720 [Nostoc sphaeroides CHAB 2801]|uniref:hypothetical protein n=1 Tax=Nostoc sphaeroides TaxID=446679 RepID=UPI0015F3201A|nr:hypothetical protein [Nostoc sphaeroides]MCC5630480.1 hypothetical protein [Nostoc sphaeroides CHAB 2801]